MNKLQQLLNGRITSTLWADMYFQLMEMPLPWDVPPRYADAIGKWYDPYCSTAGGEYGLWDEGLFYKKEFIVQFSKVIDESEGDILYYRFMNLILDGNWKP